MIGWMQRDIAVEKISHITSPSAACTGNQCCCCKSGICRADGLSNRARHVAQVEQRPGGRATWQLASVS